MDPEIDYKFQTYLAKQDKKRKEALANWDSENYYLLCTELGIAPEDKICYEEGLAKVIAYEKAGELNFLRHHP